MAGKTLHGDLLDLGVKPKLVVIAAAVSYLLYCYIIAPLLASPLRAVPGPKIYATTKWRLALDDLQGTRTRTIHRFHERYGSAVRIGPNEVSFASLSALRKIYGAGSGFERTDFYRVFDVYGRQNLFTFAGVKEHAQRKKLIAHAYSKSVILSPTATARPLIEKNVQSFLQLIEQDKSAAEETFHSLHWFSLDSITGFLYGEGRGGTDSLRGNKAHRAMLLDIHDPSRRLLSWFAFHVKTYTNWIYTRTGITERLISSLGLFPMQKPTTYTGIRGHALTSWNEFEINENLNGPQRDSLSIISKLWEHSENGKAPRLDGLDIAAELADHFLAGIDTTSDTLLFAIWALSQPENKAYQGRLIAEVDSIPSEFCNDDGNPTAEVADKLPYLDAVIKETLRLYAPLPASEPRSMPIEVTIDGFRIPAGTVVSASPFTLHRNGDVFPQPLKFNPDRWLGKCGDLTEMKRWFWAFSSGGRMCIGLQQVFPVEVPCPRPCRVVLTRDDSLAMAEMTTLLAALYRKYTTIEQERQKGMSPGVTSRFEVFHDETFERFSLHECWISFEKREA